MAYSVIALKFSCQIHLWPQLVNRPSVNRSHLLQKKNVFFSNTYVLASGYSSEFYIRKVLRGPSSSALKSGTWDLGQAVMDANLAPSLTNCVTLRKFLSFVKPQFPNL